MCTPTLVFSGKRWGAVRPRRHAHSHPAVSLCRIGAGDGRDARQPGTDGTPLWFPAGARPPRRTVPPEGLCGKALPFPDRRPAAKPFSPPLGGFSPDIIQFPRPRPWGRPVPCQPFRPKAAGFPGAGCTRGRLLSDGMPYRFSLLLRGRVPLWEGVIWSSRRSPFRSSCPACRPGPSSAAAGRRGTWDRRSHGTARP